VVQLDEPYMQARPEIAKQYAVKAINRALEGIDGETAVHLCFGYAHVVHERPEGYSFLPELNDCAAKQISIETAQSGINLNVLNTLATKKIILGVLDLSTDEIETPEIVADRIRRALDHVPSERIIVAPDCGMKYMRRDVAFGKLKAMCDGAAIVRTEL
jgi:5-methyltetrahydropteroyltriglutamate--homocysteine methyltransferase